MGPRMRKPRERWLLAGDSATGKSHAYLTKARAEMRKAKAAGKRPPAFWVIDTNDTLPKFLSPGCEFEDLAFDAGGNVYPFPCFNWEDITKSWNYIRDKGAQDDWLIIDLASQAYDHAQYRVAEARGKILDEEAFQRAIQNKGFGAFDASDWGAIKQIYEGFINSAFNNARFNVIAVSHLKDIVDVEGRNKREGLVLFDDIGLAPKGPQILYQLPDTVLLLYAYRIIPRDNRGRRLAGNEKTARFMNVVKDRGIPVKARYAYDSDLFDTMEDIREAFAEKRRQGEQFNVAAADAEEALAANVPETETPEEITDATEVPQEAS